MPIQKVRNLISAIEQGKASDDEFAMLKWLVEKRDRDAAYATVAPVDTAQYRSPRSLIPKIPPDVCVSLEEKDEEGRMNPEPTELESPSAGTGIEHPDSSVPRTGKHGRQNEPSPTAICSLAWVRIRGETSPHPRNALEREPVQLRHRQIHQTSFFGKQVTNPGTRHPTKRTSNLIPVGKERSHRFGTRL